MKYLVFTPISRKSAIAGTTQLFVRELLAQGHEVALVSIEWKYPEEVERLNFGSVHIIDWRDSLNVQEEMDSSDRVIHQIGNNWGFHAGSVVWLPRVHGLVILHDYFLGHLLIEFLAMGDALGAEARVSEYLTNWLGEDLQWLREQDFSKALIEVWERTALNEWIAIDADAIVVHSDFDVSRLKTACGIMPTVAKLLRPKLELRPSKQEHVPYRLDSKLVIGVLGHVNPNRLIRESVEAIGDYRNLASWVELNIVGPVGPEMKSVLNEAGQQAGVQILFHGQVSDDEFRRQIERCDVVLSLRNPPLESASASLLDAMALGKPCIVIDHGCYSAVPDDSAFKLSSSNIFGELVELLLKLLTDRELLLEQGNRASSYARSHEDASDYVAQVNSAFDEVFCSLGLIELGRNYGGVLSNWGGLPEGEVLNNLASGLRNLVESGPTFPRI